MQLPLVRLDSYFLGAQCLAVDKCVLCPESSSPSMEVWLITYATLSVVARAACCRPEECLQLLEQVMTPWEDEEEELPAPVENLIEEQQRQRQEQQVSSFKCLVLCENGPQRASGSRCMLKRACLLTVP